MKLPDVFRARLSIGLIALAVGVVVEPPLLAAPLPAASPPAALDASVDTCADCHEEQVTGLHRGPHRLLDQDPELAAHYGVTSSCAACHGDASRHLESAAPEDIFGFTADDPTRAKVEACISCHGDAHPRFLASHHGLAGLDCGSCHSIHSADVRGPSLLAIPESAELARVDRVSSSCYDCHGEVFAEFELNERHRLREGVISCADCHDPHAPSNRVMLGGFKQQQCVTCHADKDGPFVFEHGSQRVEGCIACHTPHGSPNRHMLTFQSVAELCYSCHAAVPGFHTRFDNTTQCTNCHSTIHGSNFDPAFLK